MSAWGRSRGRLPTAALAAVVALTGLAAGPGGALGAGDGRVEAAAAPGAAGDDGPVVVAPAAATVGDLVTVSLTGWPAGLVEVSVCGNGAARGSVDCALGAAAGATVGDGGTTDVALRLAAPPVACPCVVRATTLTGAATATTGLDLAGVDAAVAPAPAVHEPKLLVTTAVLRTAGGLAGALASAVGLHADRVLDVTVRNVGDVAVTDAPWSIWVGRGAGAGQVVAPVALGTIPPGEERSYSVDVTIDGPAAGRYVVAARIDGVPEPAVFGAQTVTWPWLSSALAVFAVCWLVGRWRSRGRERGGAAWVRAASLTVAAGGVAVLGYVAYGLWYTSAEAAARQDSMLQELDARWSAPGATLPSAPVWTDDDPAPAGTGGSAADDPTLVGEGGDPLVDAAPPGVGGVFGRITLPIDGEPVQYAVLEGVRPDDLDKGPGHYPGTAQPGEVGNMVIAGHRTSHLAPFEHLDRLQPGDEIVVETDAGRYTYAVTSSYVVEPTATDVLLPVPRSPGAVATEALLTLVTCHPKHSTAQRLIVEAVLVAAVERVAS